VEALRGCLTKKKTGVRGPALQPRTHTTRTGAQRDGEPAEARKLAGRGGTTEEAKGYLIAETDGEKILPNSQNRGYQKAGKMSKALCRLIRGKR